MKREGKDIECVEVEEAAEVNRKAKRSVTMKASTLPRRVYPVVPVVLPGTGSVDGFALATGVVVKSLHERKEECKALLGPNWKYVEPEPEVPVCVDSDIAPAAPVFSTLFGTRHTIDYPYTHKWTIGERADKTVFDFKTVNHGTRTVSIDSEDPQELMLTESTILDSLPEFGSIDVHIHTELACGMKSPSVNMVICDDDLILSPKIDESSAFGVAGEMLEFDWAVTPDDEAGHMFKLTWYTDFTPKHYAYVGNVSR